MIRLSKPIGFLLGITLGLYTRDNFVYPYPMRVQDLENDYTTLNKNIDERISKLEDTISKMNNDLQKAEGVYVTMKHKMFQQTEEDKSQQKQTPTKIDEYKKQNKHQNDKK